MRSFSLLSCCLLLLLAACPQKQGAPLADKAVPNTAKGPGTTGEQTSTEDPAETSPISSIIELESDSLMLGERLQIAIPEPDSSQTCEIQIVEVQKNADGSEIEQILDQFPPVTGTDAWNGWLPMHSGDYAIRLLDGSGQQIAQLNAKVSDWPMGNPLTELEPFVSINAGPVTDDMQLTVGLPLVAYYKVPENFPHDAWVGLFKVDRSFDGSAVADDALDSTILMSERGQFNFWPKEAGRYVVRLFATHGIPASHVCDSQQITVIEKPK